MVDIVQNCLAVLYVLSGIKVLCKGSAIWSPQDGYKYCKRRDVLYLPTSQTYDEFTEAE